MSYVSLNAPADPPPRLFRISLHAISPNTPLPCDVYIVVAGKLTLIRRAGDAFTAERLRKLAKHEVRELLSPQEQRGAFKEFLWKQLLDPSVSPEQRTESTIESTYIQAEEIDEQAPTFGPAVSDMMDMLRKFGTQFTRATSLGELAGKFEKGRNHCHAVQTALFAMVLAARAYPDKPEMIWQAGAAGLLHDLGEQRLDPRILENRQNMSGADWQVFKTHPGHSADGLAGIDGIPVEVKRAILEHHEHYDGTGFPKKLRGEEIYPVSRILTLCDVLDMLLIGKGGGEPMPAKEAFSMMQTIRPERFDPRLLSVLAADLERTAGQPAEAALTGRPARMLQSP